MSQHFTTPHSPAAAAPRPRSTAGKPNNNMTMAAVSLLGTWPLAIVAIVHATSVSKKWDAGDKTGAHKAASKAKSWAIASWCVAAVILVLLLSAG